MLGKLTYDTNGERRKCYFDTEEGSSSQLHENSPTQLYPRFCNFDSLKTGYFLSRWNTCENHKVFNETDKTVVEQKDDKKERFSQRYSATLPFGHESRTKSKKNDFVFKHHDRRDLYIEQYRYNHTVCGTGRSWYDSQIAQTLVNYVKNGHLKFPIISNHDVKLVNSVSQLADSLAESPRNSSQNILLNEPTPTPEIRPKSAKKSVSFTANRRKTPEEEGDSIVLPKIHVKECFTSRNSKKQFSKVWRYQTHRENKWACRDSGVVHLVADYRPVAEENKDATTYQWWNDELPCVGSKADRKSVNPTRSADFAKVKYKDQKKCSKRVNMKNVPTNGHLMHELLNNHDDAAAQESIQSLMKFFVSDPNVKSDVADMLNDYETLTSNARCTSMTGAGGRQKTSTNIAQELKMTGISKEKKRTERFNMYKESLNGGGRRHFKTPVRCALPLSKDTILLGAPYTM